VAQAAQVSARGESIETPDWQRRGPVDRFVTRRER